MLQSFLFSVQGKVQVAEQASTVRHRDDRC